VTTAGNLHTRITSAILSKELFRPGDTLIVALSGGADSTALLDLLATLPVFPLRLVAAHLNHCLRGSESDADEQFCRGLAARYSIPFESRRVDIKAAAAAGSLNLEDAGRRARIEFFDDLATQRGASAVVLAHHADDQAETVLMRLLRGSGMAGLSGMPWRNGRGYCRPLLDITRVEIEAYLAERHLEWREDTSNLDRSFLRNRIRHELLPLLEQYNPSVRNTLATTAGILAEENALLDDQVRLTAGQACRFPDSAAACDIPLLRSLPTALQRRLVRLMLSHAAGNLENITYRHLESILQMVAASQPNLRIVLPGGWAAVKEYGTLTISALPDTAPDFRELVIPGPGSYLMPDGNTLRIEIIPPPRCPVGSPGTAYFDAYRMPFPWRMRTFRPGDRIQPLGMDGRKKVKDLFIDEKIPPARRALTALILCGDELIWVAGLRTSHPGRVDELSTLVVKAVF
jgi:tRNA(Ile)-lysidine synthase